MAICPKCGSYKAEYRREDAGFRKTVIGSRREHRTVGFCPECGYTWVAAGPVFEKKRKSNSFSLITGMTGLILLILIPILIFSFIQARVNDLRNASKAVDYVVDETNVELVTNPSEEYILSKLKDVTGVMEVYAATSEDDPNNLFSDESGATSVVFFSYDKVDQDKIRGDNLVEKGTDSGGCIEVFMTQEDALKRDKHLGIFSISGSHKVIGTVIVRTSYKLSKEDQDELESEICKAFLGIEDQ